MRLQAGGAAIRYVLDQRGVERMKLAVLSDIHSNLEALQACLAHARQQGAEQFAFTGDLIGYGADPVACLEIIAGLAQQGAIVVKGNHDEAALSGLCETMEFNARESIYWTRTQLGAAERSFLAELPFSRQREDMYFVHACAESPELWTYITGPKQAGRCMKAVQSRFTFSGHVHQPSLYYKLLKGGRGARVFYPTPGVSIQLLANRQWLSIVGSVGQPRDGNPAANYVVFDHQYSHLTYFRVPYDDMGAARKVLAAGLPEHLANRLRRGY